MSCFILECCDANCNNVITFHDGTPTIEAIEAKKFFVWNGNPGDEDFYATCYECTFKDQYDHVSPQSKAPIIIDSSKPEPHINDDFFVFENVNTNRFDNDAEYV